MKMRMTPYRKGLQARREYGSTRERWLALGCEGRRQVPEPLLPTNPYQPGTVGYNNWKEGFAR